LHAKQFSKIFIGFFVIELKYYFIFYLQKKLQKHVKFVLFCAEISHVYLKDVKIISFFAIALTFFLLNVR